MAEEYEGERLRALLLDLGELSEYLHGRGQNAYTLAQRFLENARRDQDQKTKAFDEQQARMLDYQRYIWYEIAGLVEKLVSKYEGGGEPARDEQSGAAREEEQHGKQETAG
ncbi:MAG TPA: hypothetical protein VH599_19775 [Ktedonobacterales bacterium]|jgi:hypothetical protein